MTQEKNKIEIGTDKITLFISLIAQICVIVWIVAIMQSSTNHNKENLKEIKTLLNYRFKEADNEISDLRVRLRAAEKEISIMSSIMEIEIRRNKK